MQAAIHRTMLRVVVFGAVILLGTTNCVAGQAEDDPTRIQADLQKLCSHVFCRPPLDMTLQKEDGTVLKHRTEIPLPIVQGGMVTVYPGETIYVEADPGEDGLQNLRAVEKVLDASKTMVMEFHQSKNENDGQWYMLFKITHPFPKHVKYHAQMMLLNERIHTTSSCPVFAGLAGYESWPDTIFQLILTDFKFVSDKMLCEY